MPEATRRLMLLGGLALAGCEAIPPRAQFAEITFAHLPRIALDVARIEIVDDFVAPLEPPHVEREFPIEPAAVVRRWAGDRVDVMGLNRILRHVVTDASATEEALGTQSGVTGFFTNDQKKRYALALAARLEIVADDSRFVEAHVAARADGSVTVAEDATLDERDRKLYRLTEQVAQALDRELEAALRRHMSAYVR
ncbi:MAG: hypothetical protein FJX36_17250 [Alphaproteobacteria bacterium]|nr:hypothetical protein [Alphaproteobacteria bacterium]